MLLEGRWRFSRCCCCGVNVGTTIIAALVLLSDTFTFIAVCALPNDEDKANDSPMMSSFRQTIPLRLTTGTKAVLGIIAAIGMITSALLLYGNAKTQSKFMKPAVYWMLTILTLNTIFRIVTISTAESSPIAVLLVTLVIGIIVSLLLIQVVRSRIADVEEGQRQELPITQGYQSN